MTTTTLKGKVSTRFPARVTGVDPIVVTKQNGDYVITYKPPAAVEGPTVIDNFLALTDTPNSYSGQTAKFVKVNPGETGLEFVTVAPSGGSSDFIHPADYGVVANGVTDDTVALNNMFTALIGTNCIVLWPKNGICLTSDTVTVGSFGSGPGGPQTHVSIMGSGTTESCGIKYVGPNNKEILRFSKCTNFFISDFRINNNSPGGSGTTIGFSLTGNGVADGSNQVSNFNFTRVAVYDCNIGICAGGAGAAASEGTFIHTAMAGNIIGFTSSGLNSLDFQFIQLLGGFNGTMIDTGDGNGVNVFGGSSTGNDICFNIRQNATCQIIEHRSEDEDLFMTSNGGRVTLQGCAVSNPNPPDHISIGGYYDRLVVRDCIMHGFIKLSQACALVEVTGTTLKYWDYAHGLPVLSTVTDTQLIQMANFRNNFDASVFPPVPIPDLTGGAFGSRYDGVAARPYYEPIITVQPIDHRTTPSIGVPYLALNHVRQLSEGSMPGSTTNTAPTPGQNLRVSGAFNSSPTLAITFQRNLTVQSVGPYGGVLTATVGTFLRTDVGKPIRIIQGSGIGVADWYGFITRYLTATTVEISPASFATPGGNYPGAAGLHTATIGADEPDANYIVAGIVGNAGETFWVDGATALTTAGFTLKSSNATSTATVTALIVR